MATPQGSDTSDATTSPPLDEPSSTPHNSLLEDSPKKAPTRKLTLFDLPQELQDIIFDFAYPEKEGLEIITPQQWNAQEVRNRMRNSSWEIRPPPPSKVCEFLVSKAFFGAATRAWFRNQWIDASWPHLLDLPRSVFPTQTLFCKLGAKVRSDGLDRYSDIHDFVAMKKLKVIVPVDEFKTEGSKYPWEAMYEDDEIMSTEAYRGVAKLRGLTSFEVEAKIEYLFEGTEWKTQIWRANIKRFEDLAKPHVTQQKEADSKKPENDDLESITSSDDFYGIIDDLDDEMREFEEALGRKINRFLDEDLYTRFEQINRPRPLRSRAGGSILTAPKPQTTGQSTVTTTKAQIENLVLNMTAADMSYLAESLLKRCKQNCGLKDVGYEQVPETQQGILELAMSNPLGFANLVCAMKREHELQVAAGSHAENGDGHLTAFERGKSAEPPKQDDQKTSEGRRKTKKSRMSHMTEEKIKRGNRTKLVAAEERRGNAMEAPKMSDWLSSTFVIVMLIYWLVVLMLIYWVRRVQF